MPQLLSMLGLVLHLVAVPQPTNADQDASSTVRKPNKPPRREAPAVEVSATEMRRIRAATRRLLRDHGLEHGRHSFRVAAVQPLRADVDRSLRLEHVYAGVPVEDGGLTAALDDAGNVAVHDEGVVWDIRVAMRPRRTPAQALADHHFFPPMGQEQRYRETLILVIFPQPVAREAYVENGVLVEPDPELPPKIRPRLAHKLSTFRFREGALVPITLWIDARTGEVLHTFEKHRFRCGISDPLDSL